jgi:hypothetical protein
MDVRKRVPLVAALVTGLVALPLTFAGVAAAAEEGTTGYPSTQNPLQGVDAVGATVDNALHSVADALDGDNRPDGANGAESEFPRLDPRLVEGPVGGLLVNSPFQ